MCFQNCAKYLLVILNIAIFVAGGILAVAGLLLLFESGLLHTDVITLLYKIKYGSVRVGLVVQVVCYMMIATGAIIMVVAIIGICGAWKKIKCCLLVFVLILVITVLLQATLVGLWINVNGRSDEWLKGEMLTLIADYKGPTETDVVSKGFNKLFMKARCCGVNSYSDMESKPTSWFTVTGSVASPPEKVPATCCQGVETSSDITAKVESTCTTTPKDYYTDGCFEVINDQVKMDLLIVCIVCAIAFMVEVAAIVMSCMLLDQTKNRIRHANAGEKHAQPPPYIGIDAVLKNKGNKSKRY
ncbi:tetraspanin-3-like [Ruditapes philippinarum]|uniref:tetraspanin-3-like n=1 Tax=Ruditapes philippinarum TaxID=129788 RepID=UPI00295BE7CC|nr:tetraspanin-3-like [Ruditapes philippinarum]